VSSRIVTSLHHPWVKYARSLYHRRVRYRERAFLVEGPRVIADALRGGTVPIALFVTAERSDPDFDELVDLARSQNARVFSVSERVLAHLSETVTPQGVLAVFRFPDLPVIVPPGEAPLVLLIDRVQDPGNLGTLLRSACGAGAHAVYVSPGTSDPFAPKVVRAAAGSHFSLPIRTVEWDRGDEFLQRCVQRLAASPRATRPYDEVDWTRASAVLIGSEAHGLSAAAMAFATEEIVVPLRGGVESLNAAVAGSIILFEAARQRRQAAVR
jgi:TrmH family RNA methyltransferase